MPINYRLLLKAALCIALAALTLASGCRKKPPVVAAPPPPAPVATTPTPEPIPEPPPAEPVIVSPVVPVLPAGAIALETADRAFAARDYPTAARNYEEYLKQEPSGQKREDAIFQLGVIYALAENPQRDWQKAFTYLKRLTTDFPNSPNRTSAELIMTLRNDVTQLNSEAEKQNQRIRQLSTELDRLKQIDAERRRRSP